jgi:hypothetical protein
MRRPTCSAVSVSLHPVVVTCYVVNKCLLRVTHSTAAFPAVHCWLLKFLADAARCLSLQCATAWSRLPSGLASAGALHICVLLPLHLYVQRLHQIKFDMCWVWRHTLLCHVSRLVVIVMCMRQRVRGAFLVGILWVRPSYSPLACPHIRNVRSYNVQCLQVASSALILFRR